MADSNQLRKLVAYNQWANDKILAAIDGMMAEELARPVDAYFGTIAGNLHHVLWATRIWLARWKGETPPGRTDPIKGSWREAYARSEERRVGKEGRYRGSQCHLKERHEGG